jgi:RNA polymerase sigma-70 factor, ECF subfamily
MIAYGETRVKRTGGDRCEVRLNGPNESRQVVTATDSRLSVSRFPPHRRQSRVDAITVPEPSRDFDELFKTSYSRLARLLYRVTGDAGRAEEIASEAFIRLHRQPLRAISNVEGWLYRTGLRLALDHLKKERRRARYEALAAVFGLATSPADNPDAVLELAEERRRLRQALGALKPDQVALVLLRAEGFTYGELAMQLQLNPASVGSLLRRAEETLRKEYVKRYGPHRAR